MAVCTFFGHRDTPDEVVPKLKSALIDLIEKQGVDAFYVGNHGKFDFMVYKALKKLKENYPHIKYSVVLAYIPKRKSEYDTIDYTDTVYPEGLENVPPKYAIKKKFMDDKSRRHCCNLRKEYSGRCGTIQRGSTKEGKADY